MVKQQKVENPETLPLLKGLRGRFPKVHIEAECTVSSRLQQDVSN